MRVTDSPKTDGSGDVVTAVVVDACVTVCVSEPLEPVKLPSPPYVAVTVLVPTGIAVVLTLAVPPESVAVSVGPP
ncbi:hypothetical protein ACFVZM_15490, partial [Streptomyces sioyaensis]|uniref:hypothetical protein n=1 Tax=Streptomyces sioyaensis TaxID=67364 RepID=UPI00369B0CDE